VRNFFEPRPFDTLFYIREELKKAQDGIGKQVQCSGVVGGDCRGADLEILELRDGVRSPVTQLQHAKSVALQKTPAQVSDRSPLSRIKKPAPSSASRCLDALTERRLCAEDAFCRSGESVLIG
jgi:hypothetical protein